MIKFNRNIVLALGLIFVAIILVGFGQSAFLEKSCTEFRVNILNSEDNYFLETEDIKKVVRQDFGSPIEGSKLGQLSLKNFEYQIKDNPFVSSAEVYTDASGRVDMDIELRKPLFRVECRGGQSFYLDREWAKFPLSKKYSANAILIAGKGLNNCGYNNGLGNQIETLEPLMELIANDPFWESFISEIIVQKNQEIVLYPILGRHKIILGKPVGIKKKLRNLLLFYTQILNSGGWDKYKAINLSFSSQVVAVKH